MIDSSGSIRENNPQDGSYDNWNLILAFVKEVLAYISFYRTNFWFSLILRYHIQIIYLQQIVNNFEIGEEDTRVALLVFSELVQLEFGLNTLVEKSTMHQKCL